jgi:hypothetical protein
MKKRSPCYLGCEKRKFTENCFMFSIALFFHFTTVAGYTARVCIYLDVIIGGVLQIGTYMKTIFARSFQYVQRVLAITKLLECILTFNKYAAHKLFYDFP